MGESGDYTRRYTGVPIVGGRDSVGSLVHRAEAAAVIDVVNVR